MSSKNRREGRKEDFRHAGEVAPFFNSLPLGSVVPWAVLRALYDDELCWTTHKNPRIRLYLDLPIIVSTVRTTSAIYCRDIAFVAAFQRRALRDEKLPSFSSSRDSPLLGVERVRLIKLSPSKIVKYVCPYSGTAGESCMTSFISTTAQSEGSNYRRKTAPIITP
ncbi:unnamed protein product, partial [Nesidiocoris tenuis]